MKRTIPVVLILIGMLACVVQVVAQSPAQAAKPGAEQKRLSYLAGTWKLEASMQASSLTSAGKLTITQNNEWLPGGFHLISRSSHRAPQADPFGSQRTSTAVWGYDSGEKTYTYDAFFSMGLSEHCKGTVEGDMWTFTCPRKVNGQTLETRYTAKETSPTSYTFKVEIASGNGAGSTIMQGKATKIKGKAAKSK